MNHDPLDPADLAPIVEHPFFGPAVLWATALFVACAVALVEQRSDSESAARRSAVAAIERTCGHPANDSQGEAATRVAHRAAECSTPVSKLRR